MMAIEPLWAIGADDVIGIVLVILFIVIPTIGKILASLNKPQQPARGVRPAGRPAAGKIENEIGEFLRRAAGGRAPGAGRPQVRQAIPRPQHPGQVVRPIVVEMADERPIEAEIVVGGPREGVLSTIDTRPIAQHSANLGSNVSRKGKRVQRHLQDVFEHEVSDLAKQPSRLAQGKQTSKAKPRKTRPVEIPSTAAAGFAALLSDAQSIRQAIVLSEIINRPEHRWQ